MNRRYVGLGIVSAVWMSIAACGASDNEPNSPGLGSGGASSGGGPGGFSFGGSAGKGGVGGFSFGGGNMGGNSGFGGDGCASETRRAETIPLDMFIMFDQSASMTADAGGMSRWDAVTTATRDFLQAPESGGLGVGIQFSVVPSSRRIATRQPMQPLRYRSRSCRKTPPHWWPRSDGTRRRRKPRRPPH